MQLSLFMENTEIKCNDANQPINYLFGWAHFQTGIFYEVKTG